MIDFRDVSFSYSDAPVLRHIDFHMDDGEYIAILGPNGGGKSTFLKLALSLLKPTLGEISIQEKRISYISQVTSFSDASFQATVEEVVGLGLVNVKPRLSRKERKAKIAAVLEEMNLADLRKRLINELSGGQMQRVKVAKALVCDPSLLVLDEPDAGMDEESHHQLIALVESLHHKKVSVLFVSHHPEDVEGADKVYFIEGGSILTYEEELKREHHHVVL